MGGHRTVRFVAGERLPVARSRCDPRRRAQTGMVDMPAGLFSLTRPMATNKARIGLVGLGYVGRYVYEQISSRPELGLEIAFVHELAPERLAGLPPELIRSEEHTSELQS